MYILDIVDKPYWEKFKEECFWDTSVEALDMALAPFNAKDLPNDSDIGFETEEDATAFVLRFS